MRTSGVFVFCRRNARTAASTCVMPTPRARARSLAFWITGPSAMGSLNGTPSSMMSAPAAAIANMIAAVPSACGSPVVMYGMTALRWHSRSAAKVALMRLIAGPGATPAARARRDPSSGTGVTLSSRSSPRVELRHGGDVLVATARQVDEQVLIAAQGRCELHRVGNRMARLERGDDAFGAAEPVKRRERFLVGDAYIFGAPDVLEMRMLWPDAGIVEAGGDRVRFDDLAVVVLKKIGSRAVQHAGAAGRK